MRYPEPIRPGGKVGFIAPSFGCTTEPYRTRFLSAIEHFKDNGYETVLGPNCFSDSGIGKSNTAEACGAEVNEYLTHDHSDVIISCGGGETMCEDLPYFDFDAIAQAPAKWYMGYSDNTHLTFTLPTLCDTAAIYGPCAGDFGMKPLHQSLNDAWDIMTGRRYSVTNYDSWELTSPEDAGANDPYHVTEPFAMKTFNADGGRADFSGRLLGGCLDVLIGIRGSRWDRVPEFKERYADDGVIWFLEACELNPFRTRTALWTLDAQGWFDGAKGFLIGRPMLYGQEAFGGYTQIDAVTDILGHHGAPILMDLDIGHLPPMMPLISGALADVHAADGRISIDMLLK